MKNTLLIFDNDAQTRNYLATLLNPDFSVQSYPCDHQDAVSVTLKHQPVIILLDSFDFCKKLKNNGATKQIPIILISSKNKPSDVSEGLSLGADEFLTKPFDHKHLMVRIQNILKSVESVQNIQTVQVGHLKINTLDRTAQYQGNKMNLTLTEYDILRLLASRAGANVSREEIMKVIWQDNATETTDRTIDVHIRSLRKKVPELAEHIKSIYGVGYRYVE